MGLWMIFAALTIAALIWVMHPVLLRRKTVVAEHEFESAVYRDQLQELERDAERGLISEKEKQSALNEVSRRLLGVKDSRSTVAKDQTQSGRLVALISVTAIVAVTGFTYQKIGQPQLPDQPQKERIANAVEAGDMAAMIVRVERFLKKNPKDLGGWRVLAPALKRNGQYAKAGEAYAKIIQLDKPTASLLVEYAETLLLANQGLPTDRSRKALKSALQMDKTYAKARFYWAMTLQQDGFNDQALKEWRLLRDENPKNVEMQMAVQRQIATLKSQDAKMPTLDKDQRQAASNMTTKERQAMIGSMVQRLSDRLQEDGSDLSGWLRLIRARMVLGDKPAATAALESAHQNFKTDVEAVSSLNQLAVSLGLKQIKEN